MTVESYGHYQWHPGNTGFLKSSILYSMWTFYNSVLFLSNQHDFEPGG